jgi:5-methylcytosine-specific restriction endonuclease McrA
MWNHLREKVWTRDSGICAHCRMPITFKAFHLDHIESGKRATNALSNFRVLCRRCHVLRADNRHRGMIASALRDGIIPPNWRELVWDD